MLGAILGHSDPNLDAWYPTWMLGPPLGCLVPHLDACYPDLDAWYFTWMLGTSLLCLLSHLVWTLMYQENAQAWLKKTLLCIVLCTVQYFIIVKV